MNIPTTTLDVQGIRIPRLGFGTWELTGEECRTAVTAALDVGYRHIDTAQAYGNEAAVGAALRDASIPRDELFVTTKVWRDDARAEAVRRTTHESLGRLGLDHVDLLLLHWPVEEVPLEETLGAMVELMEQGLTRRIGVSNFTPTLLSEALRIAPIVANQVEHHPYLDQPELRAMARDRDVAIIAYSPLARGKVHEDETLRSLAQARGTTPEALTLRWLIGRPRVAAVPRSSNPEHIRSNFEALSLPLDDEADRRLREMAEGRRLIDPSFAPRWEHA